MEPFVGGCDLASLLRRAQGETEVDSEESLRKTEEYLSSPSTETEAGVKSPVLTKSDQTHRFEKTQLAKTLPRAAAWYRRPTYIAATAFSVSGLLLAAVMFYIQTQNGTIVVEIDDP